MTIEKAKQKAQEAALESGLHLALSTLDDGEYYIFGYDKEVDLSPIAINQKTGEIEDYFPPDHPAFLKANEINY